ncbi:DNA primase [Limosilactobacillus mucosae]|uniref:DNA primase n=1 Tax=Limosilactobacillus mucosae TaxID=97478 RepID=UPI00233F7496|nr:DNA primase [Limosilactobacillus mucosae]MDC2844886.1 DNA primase [Limosilactobacillus mucosae]
MARLSQELIDQVRQSVDIADVISQDVQLQRQGKNLVGHCPFHEDNTPSFSVSEQKQFFYCFSCHRSGSVFDFLMELHHLSFPQAVEQVAKLGSVTLPSDFQANDEARQSQAPDSQQSQLIKLHQTAMRLYHHILMNTPAGEPARRYLKKRGLTQELIDQFNLGYAPKEEVLKVVLEKEGHDYQLLRRSGLFTENRDGSLHDRFFDRVMFPLKDGQGRPVAFSGRLLQKSADSPKYLNSPETPIFNKRRLIFNFDLAKKAARENGKLLLFEGYMDVISAYGAGVLNGIASMGTSLTDEQLSMIVKTTNQLDICYDGDAPGQNAIERALKLIEASPVANQLRLRVVQLPTGQDPDEYIQQNGGARFREYLKNTEETPTAFRLRYLRQGLNLSNQAELLSYLNAAIGVIAKVSDPVARDVYIQQLAKEFQLSPQNLQQQLAVQVKKQPPVAVPNPTPPGEQWSDDSAVISGRRPFNGSQGQRYGRYNRKKHQATAQPAPQAVVLTASEQQSLALDQTERAERLLLVAVLHDYGVRAQLKAMPDFDFIHDQYRHLYQLALNYFTEHDEYELASFLDYVDDPALKATLTQLDGLDAQAALSPEAIDDCLRIIMQKTPLTQKIAQVKLSLQEAKARSNQELITQLTVELIELYGQKQRLKTEETS